MWRREAKAWRGGKRAAADPVKRKNNGTKRPEMRIKAAEQQKDARKEWRAPQTVKVHEAEKKAA